MVPRIVITEDRASLRLFMASRMMAMELANTPTNNLKATRQRLVTMPTTLVRTMSRSRRVSLLAATGGYRSLSISFSSTSRRSLAWKSARDMAPRSPAARCRGETVPFSMSRSPTTSM